MEPVKTFEEFKKLFGLNYSNEFIDSLRIVYALSELQQMLGDNNDTVDDEFIMRVAHNNSGVGWLYNPRKRSLVDTDLGDKKSFNNEILMSDVPKILNEWKQESGCLENESE